MYDSIMETARNSTFKNPFAATAHCDAENASSQSLSTINLVPGRSVAAAATASGGKPMHAMHAMHFTSTHNLNSSDFSAWCCFVDSCEFGSTKYFALCALGGVISCGSTHTMVVPLDLVKCRLQVDAAKYKSVFNGFKVTLKEDGVKGLSRGWSPTFIGYSLQGLCKFGLYEVFKVAYADVLGEENSYLYRTGLYLAASASAEFFADIALSPWEAAKVRIQTMPGYAKTLGEALPKMQAEGIGAFYKGLVPLWMRQIPYTMMKFACFEKTLELLYQWVLWSFYRAISRRAVYTYSWFTKSATADLHI